jgi:hypothetical protein
MPQFINQNVVCQKCFRPKMSEYDPSEGKSKIILDIASVIIVYPPSKEYPNGRKVWMNMCTQHAQVFQTWARNGILKLPREIPPTQERLDQIINSE